MLVELGNNIIDGCQAALVVNGIEVFRLWERDADGRLVCDFDVRDNRGNRLAQVARNRLVQASDGYRVCLDEREARVVRPCGDSAVRVQDLPGGKLKITGEFWVLGHHVLINEHSLISGGVEFCANRIHGAGKAISIGPVRSSRTTPSRGFSQYPVDMCMHYGNPLALGAWAAPMHYAYHGVPSHAPIHEAMYGLEEFGAEIFSGRIG